jgi:hypothetical protein
MAIQSAYRKNEVKPTIVKRWETVALAEPEAATPQLIYELLIEIRMIKLILIWVLVVIPVVAGGIILALSLIAEAQVTESPYGF